MLAAEQPVRAKAGPAGALIAAPSSDGGAAIGPVGAGAIGR
jgi:hypothetical protein